MAASSPLSAFTEDRLRELTSAGAAPAASGPRDLGKLLRSGRELARARAEAPALARLPTGLAAIDGLLAGGVARGLLTEVRGRRSSGRFSVSLALLAQATAGGEPAALVDLGGQLDPAAAEAAGVVLPRLLWVQAPRVREALSAAEIVLGSFPLVVLELGLPPLPGGRGREASWVRLARLARRHRSALLVSAPYRVSGTAAGELLELLPRQGLWQGQSATPRLLAGLEARGRAGERGREASLLLAVAGAHLPASPAAADPVRLRPRPQTGGSRRRHGDGGLPGGFAYRLPALPPETARAFAEGVG